MLYDPQSSRAIHDALNGADLDTLQRIERLFSLVARQEMHARVDKRVADAMAAKAARDFDRKERQRRDRKIRSMAARGYSDREIAAAIGISKSRVSEIIRMGKQL